MNCWWFPLGSVTSLTTILPGCCFFVSVKVQVTVSPRTSVRVAVRLARSMLALGSSQLRAVSSKNGLGFASDTKWVPSWSGPSAQEKVSDPAAPVSVKAFAPGQARSLPNENWLSSPAGTVAFLITTVAPACWVSVKVQVTVSPWATTIVAVRLAVSTVLTASERGGGERRRLGLGSCSWTREVPGSTGHACVSAAGVPVRRKPPPQGPSVPKLKLLLSPAGTVAFLITIVPACWVSVKVQVTVSPWATTIVAVRLAVSTVL